MAEATEDSKVCEVPLKVKQALKSVLISYPRSGGIPMGKLMTEYQRLFDAILPWRELGFKDLYRFLLAIPDVCIMKYREDELDNRVFAVVDDTKFMPETLQKKAKRGLDRGTDPRSPEEIMELKKAAGMSNRNASMPNLSLNPPNVNCRGRTRIVHPGRMAQGMQSLGGQPTSTLLSRTGRGIMPLSIVHQVPPARTPYVLGPESLKHEEIMEALQRSLGATNIGQPENKSVCILREDRQPFNDLTEQDLRVVFSHFGPITNVRLWPNRNYAFVKFKNNIAAERALFATLEYKGIVLLCRPEKPKINVSKETQGQKVKKEDSSGQPAKVAESERKGMKQISNTSDVKEKQKFSNDCQSDVAEVARTEDSLPNGHRDAKREGLSDPVVCFDSGEKNSEDPEANRSFSLNEGGSSDYDIRGDICESIEDGASSILSTNPSKASSLDEDDAEGCIAGFNIKESDFLNLFSLACHQEPRCAADLPDKIRFQVHSVVSASNFWIHLCDADLEVLHNLESKIPNWSSKQLPARKGHLGAAKYGFEWYRCRVLSVSDDGSELVVFFCDYGNSEIVDIKDFKYLNEEFWELPPQAIPVQIHALMTPDDDEAAKRGKAYLADCVDSHIVQAIVVKEKPNLYVISVVDLRTSSDQSLPSIEEKMEQRGYLVPEVRDALVPLGQSRSMPVENSLFPERSDDRIPVTVTMVESVQLFYVVFSNDKGYPRFRYLCKNFEPKVKPDLKQLPGLMIGVQKERNEVKRAKAIEFAPNFEKSNKVRVLYVDTGVTGWANFDDIFELTPELEQLPLQARPCALAGVTSIDEKADRVLQQEILDKMALINVIEDQLDGKLHVELFCGDTSRSINVKLAEKGLCSVIQNFVEFRETIAVEATSMGPQSLQSPDPSVSARSVTGSGKGKDTMASRALRSARSSSPCASRDMTLEDSHLEDNEERQQGSCDKVSRPPSGSSLDSSQGTPVQETKDDVKSYAKIDQSTPKSTGHDVTCLSSPVSLDSHSTFHGKSPVPCTDSPKAWQTKDDSCGFDLDLLKASNNRTSSCLEESLGDEELESETKENGEEDVELDEMRNYLKQLQELLSQSNETISEFYRARRKEKLKLRVRINDLTNQLEICKKEHAVLEKERDDLLAEA